MKTQSTYLRRYFWKGHTLWGDGYFVCTIGELPHAKAVRLALQSLIFMSRVR